MESGNNLSVFCLRFLLETANESVVFAVMPNPEPDDVGAVLHGCGSVMDTNTDRPHPSDLLEVQ
jgi:hypothetical protein